MNDKELREMEYQQMLLQYSALYFFFSKEIINELINSVELSEDKRKEIDVIAGYLMIATKGLHESQVKVLSDKLSINSEPGYSQLSEYIGDVSSKFIDHEFSNEEKLISKELWKCFNKSKWGKAI